MNDLLEAIGAGDEEAARAAAENEPALKASRDGSGLLPAIRALYVAKEALAAELAPGDEHLRPFEAAALGRRDRLRALLAEDPTHARELSPDGFTPLHGACFARDADAARLLIEHGADVEALARHEFIRVRPLGTAVFSGSVECARVLLDAGADADGEGDGGFRPLHTAASNGSAELVALLLERGADPAPALPDGQTPEQLAMAGGHEGVAATLAAAAAADAS